MAYLFCTSRLGFRIWQDEDIAPMTAISANPDVMRYFPATATPQQTKEFVARMQQLFAEKSYCYFAVDALAENKMIGFIGLNRINYLADFTPTVDIGWRLHPDFWGRGFATEGAAACLKYGFEALNLPQIVATAPLVNQKSIAVMQKIGMTFLQEFQQPRMAESLHLNPCVCYSAKPKS